jgi:hypothetical protein
MAIISQLSFFDYMDDLEDLGDLERLRLLLEYIPDGPVIDALKRKRKKVGRNDYPVEYMWNMILAGIVYRHATMQLLLDDVRRNIQLRYVISGNRMTSYGVPTASAASRFLRSLLDCQDEIHQMFDALVQKLSTFLPGLGERLAMDSKTIASYAPRQSKRTRKDGRSEHDAKWGVKTYSGTREDGSTWTKVVKTFGFKLHLLVDSVYELPLAYTVTPANRSDVAEATTLLDRYTERQPDLSAKTRYLSADRGYDDQKLVERLWNEEKTVAVIDTRQFWSEPRKPLLDYEHLEYDEKGQVYCCCPKTGVERKMLNNGYEQGRDAIRKLCPMARYKGFVCQGASACSCVNGLRIPRETDARVFQRLPRDSYKWKREYRHRTAVERVNSRFDVTYCFDAHTIRGQAKMTLRLSLALVVMLAMACAHLETIGADCTTYRSLVRPPA